MKMSGFLAIIPISPFLYKNRKTNGGTCMAQDEFEKLPGEGQEKKKKKSGCLIAMIVALVIVLMLHR